MGQINLSRGCGLGWRTVLEFETRMEVCAGGKMAGDREKGMTR